MLKKLLVVLILALMVGCTRNVDFVKQNSTKRLNEFGYEIVAYEGYQWSLWAGGDVWYMVRKIGDKNDTRYSCYLTLWNKELHLYGPWLVDKGLLVAAEN